MAGSDRATTAPLANAFADTLVGERSAAVRAFGAAAGLFGVALGLQALAASGTVPGAAAPLVAAALAAATVAGPALSAVAAARRGGLAGSLSLAAAPVAGRIAYFSLFTPNAVVALPGSFEGSGAAAFWTPVVLALGTVGFGVGTAARWVLDR
ncbi:hypothetical protein [Halosimplex halophilum]|uniref:hypothetical protein n=1 Tax=Halosimplex halophilum TaxID=2559572 RepID=UPI00107F77D4|nr:hypothetical protein [Halosimplex halophilum]